MPRLHGIHILVATSRTLKWCRDVLPDSLPRSMGMRQVWASWCQTWVGRLRHCRRDGKMLALLCFTGRRVVGLVCPMLCWVSGGSRGRLGLLRTLLAPIVVCRLVLIVISFLFCFALLLTVTLLMGAVRGQRSLASFRQLLGGCPVGASRC